MKNFKIITTITLIIFLLISNPYLVFGHGILNQTLNQTDIITCNSSNDCPIGTCSNGKTFPQYACGNGICNTILYFVDPCLDLSSSSSSGSSSCKCNTGERFDGSQCIQGNDVACTLEFNPVCGCNGTTYGNACAAKADGIKEFTEGECLSNSSSGSSNTINKNFSGTWKGKVFICSSSTSEPSPITCVTCPKIEILCTKGTVKIPQSCLECAHCQRCKDSRSLLLKTCVQNNSISGTVSIQGIIDNGEIISTSIQSSEQLTITAQDKETRAVTLSLSLDKNRKLTGSIDSTNSILEARKIKSSKNCDLKCKRSCGPLCCSKDEECLVLESFPVQYSCSPNSTSSSTSGCPIPSCAPPPEGCNYEFTDEKDENGCPKFPCGNLICSSSGLTDACAPKGSCRGDNGEQLSCPNGTECSGLPAYGCYPLNCPVPICCSPHTMILTPQGQKDIENIKKGDYVISNNGEPAIVVKTTKVRVYNHKVVEVKLNDGTLLEISPGHPIGPGSISFGSLKKGYKLDGRIVESVKLIPYKYSYTHDILPYSLTGNYYANGVLIGSSLFMSGASSLYKY